METGKTVIINKKAFFDYEILERVEAGIVLTGTEIKSIRAGKVNIREGYVRPEKGELWLLNAHIAAYNAGGVNNHEPTRPRKLLLHKDQILELSSCVDQKGLTIVPLRLTIKNHVAKLELGLARGKRKYDKRRTIMDRERDREARRAISRTL